jgi:hypothetical protein
MEIDHGMLVSGWIALHAMGLIVAFATRLTGESRRIGVLAQLSFFVLLTCLGGVAWWSHQLELGVWIPTGFTMGAMLLLATADLSSATHPIGGPRVATSDRLY